MSTPSASTLGRRATAEGIYACLAIAVVCAAWEYDNLGELALEVLLYSVALWLFHVYAQVVHGGWERRGAGDLWAIAKHEWPHLEAALPAVVVVLLGWSLGLDPVGTSDVAMAATLANLLVWQVALLLPRRPSTVVLLVTLALDVAVAAALIMLRLWIK